MPERAAERAVGAGGLVDGLADAEQQQRSGNAGATGRREPANFVTTCGLAHDNDDRRSAPPVTRFYNSEHHTEPCSSIVGRPNPTNGFWSDADWLFCRDGKWRPVESGTFPLAYGASARVGRLRGYGNAIVAPAAQAFVEAYLETELVAANDNHCTHTLRPCA